MNKSFIAKLLASTADRLKQPSTYAGLAVMGLSAVGVSVSPDTATAVLGAAGAVCGALAVLLNEGKSGS